jgi:uncharacterized damage-inducible protein DinB
MANLLIQDYLRQLNLIYEGAPWIDESFAKKLDSVSEEDAFRRPLPEVHSVAEVLSHLIEWRRELIKRFQTGRPAFPLYESEKNWYSNAVLKERGWSQLREDFAATQQELIQLWESWDDDFLQQSYQDEYPYHYLVEGIVHHDLYHLGQIGLIIKMLGSR